MAALSVQSLTTVHLYLCGLSFLKIVLVGAPRSFVPLTDTWGHEHWGEVSESEGGGDKSWHQTLLFASDKSVCFVRNKQEWFCTNSWLIRTPATLSKFWKRVQNPTTFGGSLKKNRPGPFSGYSSPLTAKSDWLLFFVYWLLIYFIPVKCDKSFLLGGCL